MSNPAAAAALALAAGSGAPPPAHRSLSGHTGFAWRAHTAPTPLSPALPRRPLQPPRVQAGCPQPSPHQTRRKQGVGNHPARERRERTFFLPLPPDMADLALASLVWPAAGPLAPMATAGEGPTEQEITKQSATVGSRLGVDRKAPRGPRGKCTLVCVHRHQKLNELQTLPISP